MTSEQVLRQIRYLLRNATWTDSPTGPLFGSPNVFLSAGFDAARLGEVNFPFCVIAPGGFQPMGDGENPSLGEFEGQIHIFVRHEGDRLGEYVLVGGHRVETTGAKTSRGILELEEEVIRAIKTHGPATAFVIDLQMSGDTIPEVVQGSFHVLRKEISFRAMVSNHRTYAPVYAVGASGTPTVTITWSDPVARFDLLGAHVRVIAGSTAPTLSNGTAVATVLAGVQTTTHAPVAGTWTYGVWGTYDETGNASVERYSDRVASKTVTI